MPGLLIKDIPAELHLKLKEQAARHHRSMTREALALLEEGLLRHRAIEPLPPPYKGRRPLTDRWLQKAKRDGRA